VYGGEEERRRREEDEEDETVNFGPIFHEISLKKWRLTEEWIRIMALKS
jgi:hypothetical protein